MPRLQADADPARWLPVTGSLSWKGRRHRKAAIRMLMAQAGAALGTTGRRGGGLAAWAISQATPLLMRRADGRVLAWVWRQDPELVVAMAQIQELTAQLRTARAMMPMEYDDTVPFDNRHLGRGEKLVIPIPPQPQTPPFATYSWDTGTHLVTLTAVCGDRERFGTVITDVDEVAASLRISDEVLVARPTVLRLDPT
ncbi:hypothetical protein [Microbacterium sp.]|uniref:hypothetical protein n=1 Tax=Microbacterium sp. TaxID=51671 RepID=UPI003A863DEC